jgi:hypothetical protein
MRSRLIVLALAIGLSSLILAVLPRSSTAQMALGPSIQLFMEEGFKGPAIDVAGTLIDMPTVSDPEGVEISWNDNVGSVIVFSGTWRINQHGRCNTEIDETPLEKVDLGAKKRVDGWSCLISATSKGPLKISRPGLGGFSRDVSSIELVSEKNLEDWALPVVKEE